MYNLKPLKIYLIIEVYNFNNLFFNIYNYFYYGRGE